MPFVMYTNMIPEIVIVQKYDFVAVVNRIASTILLHGKIYRRACYPLMLNVVRLAVYENV